MARIKGITDSEAGAEVRQIFDEQKKRHGFVSNAAQVSAVRPTIQKGRTSTRPGHSGVRTASTGATQPGLRPHCEYQWLSILN